MQAFAETSKHIMVGGGIASLAAAALLIRDVNILGHNIVILEKLPVLGGSLDASGGPDEGYLIRGGRMFEKNFVCTFDLLDNIPCIENPARSVSDDIKAFNASVPGSSECRLFKNGRKAEDRFKLLLSAADIKDVSLLLITPENRLGGRKIESWFQPDFFKTNFWIMWSTMFSFQPWHSLAEMRRYMVRFIHLLPGLTRIAGVLRTRYNQYDSLILPIRNWLAERGVEFRLNETVRDIDIEGDLSARFVRRLLLESGESIELTSSDRIYITFGSMTESSRNGSNSEVPSRSDQYGAAWRLWRRLAKKYEGLGHPEVFCGDTQKTAWHSFTVTMHRPEFFTFMEDFTGNRTGTGGLVTFAGSGWTLSIVMSRQPLFREQASGSYVFWGYGLTGDKPGDFVKKSMWETTGREIIEELSGQLRLNEVQKNWFSTAKVVSSRMPFITSQFMPRNEGDRPKVRPEGAENFAIMGQYCEIPRDCVFTVEYSVRSAWLAVHALTQKMPLPPAVKRTDRDPLVLLRAANVLLRG